MLETAQVQVVPPHIYKEQVLPHSFGVHGFVSPPPYFQISYGLLLVLPSCLSVQFLGSARKAY